MKLLDTVRLKRDRNTVRAGDIGAIVDIYDELGAYEVEFVRDDGSTKALLAIRERDLEVVSDKQN